MISCNEAMRWLWEYLDGTIDPADRAQVEEHLERCRTCCGELEFAEEVRRRLAQPTVDAVDPDVVRRLNETVEGLGR